MASAVVRAGVLDIAYDDHGDPTGTPVVLSHGFPYDVRCYDDVVTSLVADCFRVVVPWLRGYGATRFVDDTTLRSGQQAALAHDLIELMDALDIDRAVVGGYDWGGRAACIAAALWPERVIALVTAGGYNVQDIAHSMEPAPPEHEASYWYQYYFHSERGRAGLERNRDELCNLLWRMWSPTWTDADAAFPASAPSLHNPDFVDVVIHSYRHRYALVAGDERYEETERLVADQPAISVPTVVIDCGADGVSGPSGDDDRERFTGWYERVFLPNTGHNVPQEAPAEFAAAVVAVASAVSARPTR